MTIVERAMDLADMLRQFETDDEDLKVAQVLAMRCFNAFAASLKLALSGYGQNSTLIMRDVMETMFLLDLFRGDRALIELWRFADKKTIDAQFSPLKVRMALDTRDGSNPGKRAEIYKRFSELAAHPTMKSDLMMRPQKDGDAIIGPFIEENSLDIVLSEMGRLAVQVGEILDAFFPIDWLHAVPTRAAFGRSKLSWMKIFYPGALSS